jgi:hypothetical protein
MAILPATHVAIVVYVNIVKLAALVAFVHHRNDQHHSDLLHPLHHNAGQQLKREHDAAGRRRVAGIVGSMIKL